MATEYGKQPVHTDGGTWYPQACRFLKLKHHLEEDRPEWQECYYTYLFT
jgi:hypothetical protein